MGLEIERTIGCMSELSDIKFDCADAIEEKIKSRLANGQKLRSVYTFVNPFLYYVRLGMGGRQWELGRTRDRQAAVRFADMAILYFWKYRKRRLRLAPSDADVNLSVEQAKIDLDANLPARTMLGGLEAGLLAKGAIFDLSRPTGEFVYSEVRKDLLRGMGQLRASVESCRNYYKDSTLDLHASVLFSELEIMERRVREFDRVAIESAKVLLCK